MALYNKAYSIAECVNELYPDGNAPQELLEACELEVLYEMTKRKAQLKVLSQQTLDSLRGKEWDTKQIDKMIKTIEDCNKSIADYKNGNDRFGNNLANNPEYVKKLLKTMFWAGALGFVSGAALGPLGVPVAAGVGAYLGRDSKDSDGNYWPKLINDLEEENKKALKWLKEERKRVTSGKAEKKSLGKIITGKQESTIFSSIEII